jgi:hypothetical protein
VGQAHSDLEQAIDERKVLDDPLREQLRAALEEFNQGFDTGPEAAPAKE